MSTPFRSSSSPHNIAKRDTEYLDALTADGKTKEEAERFASFDKASPYFANRTQSGMAEHDLVRARALRDNLVSDVKALAKIGLDADDVGAWAYASHAKARNAQKTFQGLPSVTSPGLSPVTIKPS